MATLTWDFTKSHCTVNLCVLLPHLLPGQKHTLLHWKNAWIKCRVLMFNKIHSQPSLWNLSFLSLWMSVQLIGIMSIMKNPERKMWVYSNYILFAKHKRWLQGHFMSPWRCFIQFSTKRLLLFNPQAVTQPQEDSGSLNTHYPKAQVERRYRTDIPAVSDRFAGDWCEQFGPKMLTYFAPSAAIS